MRSPLLSAENLGLGVSTVAVITGCIHLSWPGVILAVAALGFASFVFWLDPSNRYKVEPSEVEGLKQKTADLEHRCEELKGQLQTLRVKLGFIQR